MRLAIPPPERPKDPWNVKGELVGLFFVGLLVVAGLVGRASLDQPPLASAAIAIAAVVAYGLLGRATYQLIKISYSMAYGERFEQQTSHFAGPHRKRIARTATLIVWPLGLLIVVFLLCKWYGQELFAR